MLSFIGWPYQIPVSESGIGPFLPFIYAIAHSLLRLPHPILSEMDAPSFPEKTGLHERKYD